MSSEEREWKSAPGCPEPTPELVAVAKRVATREWTVAPDDPVYPIADPNLALLVGEGLATLHYPPTRERLDHWTLTCAGRAWLKLAHGWLSGRSQDEVEAEILREQRELLRRSRRRSRS